MATETTKTVNIADVRDRAGADTRKLDPAHVVELAESIGSLGVIEPLVVDQHGRLLGGLHRRHACLLLAVEDGEQRKAAFLKLVGKEQVRGLDALADRVAALDRSGWLDRHIGGQVPVRVVPIDSAKAKDEALRVEVTENEKRRDYSRDEIVALAERLRAQAYVDRAGRPKAGERALRPALAAIIGKSGRHLRSVLNGGEAKRSAKAKAGAIRRGGRGKAGWSSAVSRLRAAVKGCRSAAKGQRGAGVRRLVQVLAQVERALGRAA